MALTLLSAPLSRWAGEGTGVRVHSRDQRLPPWATRRRPLCGLTS